MAKRISDELIKQIKVLFNEGMPLLDIALRLELGKSTVEKYVKALDLKRERKKSLLDASVLEEIRNLYTIEKLGSTTIARKLGINEATVVRQLKNMNISLRTRNTIDVPKIIDMYVNQYKPIHVIAKELKSSEERISKLLKENGVEIYGHKMPRFDYHIFDSIDTEEKAYWLGFIFADGYTASINPNRINYAFELSLKAEDYEHLNAFNDFMKFQGNNVKIGKNTLYTISSVTEGVIVSERCRWCISNQHLWEVLNSYGCTPRKSATLQFPNINIFKSNDLIRHFIRGYWDGDGCISHSYQNNNEIPKVSAACKSEDFIKKVLLYIPFIEKYYSDKKGMYIIQCASRKAMQLLHYLYDDCTISLPRKYNKFLYFCNTYENMLNIAPYIRNNISKLGNIGGSPSEDNTEIISEITQGSETS